VARPTVQPALSAIQAADAVPIWRQSVAPARQTPNVAVAIATCISISAWKHVCQLPISATTTTNAAAGTARAIRIAAWLDVSQMGRWLPLRTPLTIAARVNPATTRPPVEKLAALTE
jgi:hypothetical protein